MSDKLKFFIGVGFVFITLGAVRMLGADPGPPTGRWEIVLGPIYAAIGHRGLSLLIISAGLMFIVTAYINPKGGNHCIHQQCSH